MSEATRVIEKIDLHLGMMKLKRAEVVAEIEGLKVTILKVYAIFNVNDGSDPILDILPEMTIAAINDIKAMIFNKYHLDKIRDHIEDYSAS
jgi:hypothetical protein